MADEGGVKRGGTVPASIFFRKKLYIVPHFGTDGVLYLQRCKSSMIVQLFHIFATRKNNYRKMLCLFFYSYYISRTNF